MSKFLSSDQLYEDYEFYSDLCRTHKGSLEHKYHWEMMQALYAIGATLKKSLEDLNEPLYPEDVEP